MIIDFGYSDVFAIASQRELLVLVEPGFVALNPPGLQKALKRKAQEQRLH